MRFTVVIPAFNEEANVTAAIKGVIAQELDDRDLLEILVVDNNSDDGTRAVAERALGKHGRVLVEKRAGPNHARQRGFIESSGEVLCFLDSDCIIPHEWIKRIKVEIEKGAVAVSGPYYYGFSVLYQKFLNRLYASLILPALPLVLSWVFRRKAAVIIGGNFAVTRAALQKIGGIPPISFWGDDAVIAMMLVRKVGPVRFSKQVWAQSSPRRYDKDGFWRVNHEYTKAYFRAFFNEVGSLEAGGSKAGAAHF